MRTLILTVVLLKCVASFKLISSFAQLRVFRQTLINTKLKATPDGDNSRPIWITEREKISLKSLLATASIFAINFAANAAGTGSKGYLVEPTSEFLAEEKRVAAYAAAGAKLRKDWDASIEKLVGSEEPIETKKALTELLAILKKYDNGKIVLS